MMAGVAAEEEEEEEVVVVVVVYAVALFLLLKLWLLAEFAVEVRMYVLNVCF